jgi:hypothetical protein
MRARNFGNILKPLLTLYYINGDKIINYIFYLQDVLILLDDINKYKEWLIEISQDEF